MHLFSYTKNTFLVLQLFTVLTSLSVIRVNAEPEKKPNIIFIMADDLGWQDVGFMGSKYFETPHLDALAEQSLVFQNAYMYPTCSPSRAALLTGQQSFRTGCYTVPVLEKGKSEDNIFSKWTVKKNHPLYSEPLHKAGYKLIHLGKWHIVGPYPDKEDSDTLKKKLHQPKNGDLSWLEKHRSPAIQQFYPTGRGFHENVGGCWWGDPAKGYDEGYKAPSGGYIAPFKNPFITEKPDDTWLTDRLTSDAIDFIERHQAEPFFINLHYYAPHRPTVSRDPTSLAHFQNKPADPVTGQGGSKNMAAYATMVKSLDDNIKRITDYLDASGLRENTIIFFTSDNGFNGIQSKSNKLRGAKGYLYEGGIRVPALINWKNTIAPTRSQCTIQGLDYFPTFLELAGISDFTGVLDGDSLVPLINNTPLKERAIFLHVASTYKNPPASVIIKGEWKLIQFLKKGNIELYNLKEDLKESTNRAAQNPEIAEQLVNQLSQWRKTHQVPLPPSSELAF